VGSANNKTAPAYLYVGRFCPISAIIAGQAQKFVVCEMFTFALSGQVFYD
jgi:hypothetical protein